MESMASAGQILLSEETARLLPRRCLGSPCGPGVLLARTPSNDPPHGYEEPMRLPDEVVAECLSTAVRAHVLAGPVAPEHRTATATFIQFGDLDDLIDECGADVAARALDELVQIVQDAADRYEVCLLASDVAANGGKLLLSSGAPRAVGDDEERMLLALRQVIESKPCLPIRIGVNRGHVFTGEVGPPYRRTYAVMGDAVNLAARLSAKASWGTILATAGVLERSKTRFEKIPVPPFMVKGKARPVEAWTAGKVLGAAPPSSALRRAPLVGREDEVAVLRGLIDDASRGRGGLVEIVGETGTGASRLLAEAREFARGMRFVHASCEPYTRGFHYAGWRDLLRQLLGIARDDPDALVVDRLRAELEPSQPDLLPWLPLLAIAAGAEAAPTREVEELSLNSARTSSMRSSSASSARCSRSRRSSRSSMRTRWMRPRLRSCRRFRARSSHRRGWSWSPGTTSRRASSPRKTRRGTSSSRPSPARPRSPSPRRPPKRSSPSAYGRARGGALRGESGVSARSALGCGRRLRVPS